MKTSKNITHVRVNKLLVFHGVFQYSRYRCYWNKQILRWSVLVPENDSAKGSLAFSLLCYDYKCVSPVLWKCVWCYINEGTYGPKLQLGNFPLLTPLIHQNCPNWPKMVWMIVGTLITCAFMNDGKSEMFFFRTPLPFMKHWTVAFLYRTHDCFLDFIIM